MSKLWCKAAAIRAVKTMAQSFIAMVGTSMVLDDVSWTYVFSAMALSGILSIATSIAGLPEVDMEENE